MATTSKKILADLVKALGDQYAEQLAPLPFKKGVREALIDGFRMGLSTGVRHTCQMLEVEIIE